MRLGLIKFGHFSWLASVFALLLTICPIRLGLAEVDKEVNWLLILQGRLRLGASEKEVAGATEGLLSKVQSTNGYTGKYPFRDLLPYLNPKAIVEWRTTGLESDGWPEILVTVFSNSSKTNLVDALSIRRGRVEPVVDGAYNHNLYSLRRGDSVEKLYRLAGKRNCEYSLGSDEKWRVRFVYSAYAGRFFIVEADAANGEITYAHDGTL